MPTIALPDFTPGQPAACVDESLRQALAGCDRAQECAVLWFAEIARRGLFRELGFASLELYATQGLGFSRNRFFQFARLSEDLERLPRLRAAVESGEVGWTKAQQVARVATPASEGDWVVKAATVSRRELEDEVKKVRGQARQRRRQGAAVANPAIDPPTTISFRLDGIQLARYEALVERIRKLGLVPREAGREELMLAALAALAEEEGAELRRRNSRKINSGIQIVVRRCPECERSAVVTSRGEKRLKPAEAQAVSCDARVQTAHGPNRATIKPSVRAAVLARDGHRCTTPGCGAMSLAMATGRGAVARATRNRR